MKVDQCQIPGPGIARYKPFDQVQEFFHQHTRYKSAFLPANFKSTAYDLHFGAWSSACHTDNNQTQKRSVRRYVPEPFELKFNQEF